MEGVDRMGRSPCDDKDDAQVAAVRAARALERSRLILSDKFEPAALPDVCAPRLRVVDAFDRAARKRFVYVAAPAGSG